MLHFVTIRYGKSRGPRSERGGASSERPFSRARVDCPSTLPSTTKPLSSRDTRRKRPRHSNRIPSRPYCFSSSIFLSSIVLVSRSRQNYRHNAATTWQPYARPFTSFWLSLVWKTLSHSQHVAWLCSEARSGTE